MNLRPHPTWMSLIELMKKDLFNPTPHDKRPLVLLPQQSAQSIAGSTAAITKMTELRCE
jgi:hypothetical protein